MKILPPVSIEARRLLPSRWDLLAAALVLGFIVAFADTSRFLIQPLSVISGDHLSLDPALLPGYALRTGLRMLLAMGVSLAFTFSYATWAAKNPRAGTLLVPLLDILQSVPILGFLSVTAVWFLSLSPGRVFGAELACVFAIFTSQAWNMAFSFYQSLRTVPEDLTEAGRMFGLSAWARFWRITLPLLTPTIFFQLIIEMIDSFKVFTEAFVITNGGPLKATYFFMLYFYEEAFRNANMGYASALALFLTVIILATTIFINYSSERWVYYESE